MCIQAMFSMISLATLSGGGLLLIRLAIALDIVIICWLKAALRKQISTTKSVSNKFWVPEDERGNNPLVGEGFGPDSIASECKNGVIKWVCAVC